MFQQHHGSLVESPEPSKCISQLQDDVAIHCWRTRLSMFVRHSEETPRQIARTRADGYRRLRLRFEPRPQAGEFFRNFSMLLQRPPPRRRFSTAVMSTR